MDAKTREEKGIQSLPGSLKEAVDLMLRDELICGTLGEHVVTQYSEGKYREWDEYRTTVSDWELKKYLTIY